MDAVTDAKARSVELLTTTYFYDRLHARLDGLTDEEHLWHPVPDALTIDPDASGPVPRGRDGQVTTIAWRLAHIGDGLREERNWHWLGRQPVLLDHEIRHAPTAAGGIAYLEASHAAWRDLLGSLTPDELWSPIGPAAGPYAATERIDFVLHMVDELIHHAAEVALLRDLYAAMSGR